MLWLLGLALAAATAVGGWLFVRQVTSSIYDPASLITLALLALGLVGAISSLKPDKRGRRNWGGFLLSLLLIVGAGVVGPILATAWAQHQAADGWVVLRYADGTKQTFPPNSALQAFITANERRVVGMEVWVKAPPGAAKVSAQPYFSDYIWMKDIVWEARPGVAGPTLVKNLTEEEILNLVKELSSPTDTLRNWIAELIDRGGATYSLCFRFKAYDPQGREMWKVDMKDIVKLRFHGGEPSDGNPNNPQIEITAVSVDYATQAIVTQSLEDIPEPLRKLARLTWHAINTILALIVNLLTLLAAATGKLARRR